MSITAAPEKRTLASTLFTVYTLIIALTGAGLIYLSVAWPPAAGVRVYAVLGLALLACGVMLWRRRRVGLWLFGLAALATWVWAIVAPPLPQAGMWQLPVSGALPALSFAEVVTAGMALLGLVLLAFWPVARKRLVGVAKPGYVIINGVLPLALIMTLVWGRLA